MNLQRLSVHRLGIDPTTPAVVHAIARGELHVILSEPQRALLERRRAALDRAVAAGMRIYGVTTGFGPLADLPAAGDTRTTQRHLIAHLASGVGAPFSPIEARAIAALRADTLARGLSCASPGVIDALASLLNAGLAPCIPSLGSVGASGDLTPLAHLALGLTGDGELIDGRGPEPARDVLARHGLPPLVLDGRDGLAIVNGTAATTALAAIALDDLEHALDLAIDHTVAAAEVLQGRREAWHALPAVRRPHAGQARVQRALAERGNDSERLLERSGSEGAGGPSEHLPQDAYVLRCAQQILGAVDDVLTQARGTIETELASITDNPLFDFGPDDAITAIVHGGNFMGLHCGFAVDHLHNGLVALAAFLERRINRLTHPLLNGDLPAFLAGSEVGPNSGFMGAQVTASALLAELRTRALPSSGQSIPTNGDNQDFVPMATVGARRLRESLERLGDLLAIERLVLAQGIDLRGGPTSGFSTCARTLHDEVRRRAPKLVTDRPLSVEIREVRADVMRVRVRHSAGGANAPT